MPLAAPWPPSPPRFRKSRRPRGRRRPARWPPRRRRRRSGGGAWRRSRGRSRRRGQHVGDSRRESRLHNFFAWASELSEILLHFRHEQPRLGRVGRHLGATPGRPPRSARDAPVASHAGPHLGRASVRWGRGHSAAPGPRRRPSGERLLRLRSVNFCRPGVCPSASRGRRSRAVPSSILAPRRRESAAPAPGVPGGARGPPRTPLGRCPRQPQT